MKLGEVKKKVTDSGPHLHVECGEEKQCFCLKKGTLPAMSFSSLFIFPVPSPIHLPSYLEDGSPVNPKLNAYYLLFLT